ncbi:MAG: hypothetical protein A2Z14_08670 [Chloroflexi bacterium RBG_16_48_8]|nr:MAG: hypothetical protein A2Z14_08670 [Chloroflexi bacterium RBG_16_48_8]
MPTLRTEASELSVAFGILGLDPTTHLTEVELEHHFQGTLDRSKYDAFLLEYSKRHDLHSRMRRVGRQIRNAEPLFSQIDTLQWTGPTRQASTATASADLIAANTPISVKAISNVAANPSPHNLIYNLPGGQAFTQHEDNWYIVQDRSGFQALYSFMRNSSPSVSYLPTDVAVFEATATRVDRMAIQHAIKLYGNQQRRHFTHYYLEMCHRVAEWSAQAFNSRFCQSMQGRSRSAVIENLMRWFFRLDSVSYIMCGIDSRQEFAVRLPSLTEWKSSWRLTQMTASPDITRRQSIVDFELTFEDTN